MKAILKKDNVYVLVRDKNPRAGITLDNLENLILCDDLHLEHKSIIKNNIYGGRVYLEIPTYHSYGNDMLYDYCYLTIDGIEIMRFELYSSTNKLSFDHITAYLNQIENLGVDSFLENYKLQLQEIKKEFESMKDELQSELAVSYDENKASTLDSLKEMILSITCIIFSLLINMNAGLNNHHYINAYNEIINMYF